VTVPLVVGQYLEVQARHAWSVVQLATSDNTANNKSHIKREKMRIRRYTNDSSQSLRAVADNDQCPNETSEDDRRNLGLAGEHEKADGPNDHLERENAPIS
jgi:hypothetical protein